MVKTSSSDVLAPVRLVRQNAIAMGAPRPQVIVKPIDKAAKALRARRFTLSDRCARTKFVRNMKLINREVFDDPSDTIKDLSAPIKTMLLETIKQFYKKDKSMDYATADIMEQCVDAGLHVSTRNDVTFLYGRRDESGNLTTEMRVRVELERQGFRIVTVDFVNKTYDKMTAFTQANPCTQATMAVFQAERHAKHLAVGMLTPFFPVKNDSMILSECVGHLE